MQSKRFLFKTVFLLFLISWLTACTTIPVSQSTPSAVNGTVTDTQVYFSPDGGCTKAIIEQIDNAKSDILIQAYSFTYAPIAKALVNAHKKGIKIEAILDKSNVTGNYSSATYLSNNGIPVFIDAAHAIAHNKIIIIDKEIVITGSFNFTKAAEEKNAENLLVIKSKELANTYLDNWNKHKEHSYEYKRKQ